MQDGKALQAGTSHYLGKNFAEAANIRFLGRDGVLETAHTTSWGLSTRMVGGLIMTHSDDDGLRVPPRIAPKHAIIIPVLPKPELEEKVFGFAQTILSSLKGIQYEGEPLRIHFDKRDIRGGDKNWQWIKKGAPLRIEIGPRDVDQNSVVLYRRDQGVKEKIFLNLDELPEKLPIILAEIQANYFAQAKKYREELTSNKVSNFEEFQAFFAGDETTPGKKNGFIIGKWCGEQASLGLLDPLKVTVRCIPTIQDGITGKCVLTGKPASTTAVFAKSY